MKKRYICNVSPWKRRYLESFFPDEKVIFVESLEGLTDVTIWGNKHADASVSVERIEDGFIRSVALGVDFSQPYSLVIDKRGIYYDSTRESDLEHILLHYVFDEALRERARRIQKYLIDNRLSKYNIYQDKTPQTQASSNQKTILVIGQVEGDASLIYGAENMKNIELLQSVHEQNKDAYIVFKPHPDVLSGKREGHIEDDMALQYCNQIEKEISIDSLLSIADEVHTMTSLVGMEALIRGKKVVCYGIPFYAGWGLTEDKKVCRRRTRKLTLHELIAATYILYPRYIDPKTRQLCEVERVLEHLTEEKKLYHQSAAYRWKKDSVNFIYKKYHAIMRNLPRRSRQNYLSISQPMIQNVKNFFAIHHATKTRMLLSVFQNSVYTGWGRKRSGLWAVRMSKIFRKRFLLLEDGFIRSFGLGVSGSPSFSLVVDDVGFYYDSTQPSRLENILAHYDFANDTELMEQAREAIGRLTHYKISKYNKGSLRLPDHLKNNASKVLIIAQTAGDSSLIYGRASTPHSRDMIDAARREHPKAELYLKIHPDVLTGKKESSIDIDYARRYCTIITEDINPIVLLEPFGAVYTQTSQMGFEALLLGKKVTCFGMPFYAGWGVTDDRQACKRRSRTLSIKELFAGAYILYPIYYNPCTHRPSDILDTIETLHKLREGIIDPSRCR